MEILSIDGKSFVKASRLAKEFGYTSDYIGQLCRADKVDAQLVGRSWYVDRESLQSHKDGKYKKKSELLNGRAVPATLRRSNIVVKPKSSSSFLYDEDETDLIPNPYKQVVDEKEHKLAINIARPDYGNRPLGEIKNLSVKDTTDNDSDNTFTDSSRETVKQEVIQTRTQTQDKTIKPKIRTTMGDIGNIKIGHKLSKRIPQRKKQGRKSFLPLVIATAFVAMLLSSALISIENVVYIDQGSIISSHLNVNFSSLLAVVYAYK